MIDLREFRRPEMWETYDDLEAPARALLTQHKPRASDGEPLTAFIKAVNGRGLDGAVAATTLVTQACVLLAEALRCHPSTVVALVSRVVPWRDKCGAAINSILSAWVAHNDAQALVWCQWLVDDGYGAALARGLGERLLFLVESSAVMKAQEPWEEGGAFADVFFDQAT
jgi:hypothetical protein